MGTFARNIAAYLALAWLCSCTDAVTFTTSPSARLAFSADTVAFDTVVSGAISSTRSLVVFNNNSDAVRIVSVRLASGEDSRWMCNVDGEYLYNGSATDFEVFAHDSIYVRLACLLPDTDSDELTPYDDALLFELESGAVQSVALTAEGLDVIRLEAPTYASSTTLQAQRPFLVTDSLVVRQGATLTLAPGTTLMMHDSTSIIVRGELKAIGTIAEPITLRGDRTDRMFSYLPYDNTPNRWGGIRFESGATGTLEQCDIHAGDYGIEATDATLRIINSTIHNVGGDGLNISGGTALVAGTQVSNTLGNCVSLSGGESTFIHCTLAQFYPFSSNRGNALLLANDPTCSFVNTAITGYADDELMGENITDEASYEFINCLLRTPAVSDYRYEATVWDDAESAKEHFRLFDTVNFLYDFAPDSLSTLRGAALRTYSLPYSTDMRGNSRLLDDAPDIGAFEGQ